MTKYHKLLVKFMKIKRNIVMYHSGIELMNAEDWDELGRFTQDEVHRTLSSLDCTDGSSCPWCILKPIVPGCSVCGYGKRHGICNHDVNSTYADISATVFSSIMRLSGMEQLVNNTKTKYKELCNE